MEKILMPLLRLFAVGLAKSLGERLANAWATDVLCAVSGGCEAKVQDLAAAAREKIAPQSQP